MLPHFYHQLTKKYVAAFGSVFNDITLVRYNKAHTSELKRSKVPLVYGPREKYLVRINDDPDLEKKVQQTYPIMSFNILDFVYNPDRKLPSLLKIPKANNVTGLADNVYGPVPYDLMFQLSIVARHKDDALQILEQVLPIFNPDFNFSQIPLPELGFVNDISIILNAVSNNTEYEDDFDTIRSIEFVLDFTMKVYYYGPIYTTNIIRRAFANTFLDPNLYAGSVIRVNLNNGNNGTFQLNDYVFQGTSISEAQAAGIVTKWDSNNGYLRVGSVQGDFRAGENVKAMSTNAVYNLASFDMTPLKLQSIKVEPDPSTANVGDAFGFDEETLEYPDTVD